MTGIILAGGKSTRMGMEKGLVMFKGKPLIRYALDVLIPLCDEILISSNSERYRHFGHEIIPDEIPGIGPMGGIYSCLKQSKNELNLVLSCDMPFVTPEIYGNLLSVRTDSTICIPWYEGEHFEPMCGVYHKNAIHIMQEFIMKKNYKLPDLFKCTSFTALKIADMVPAPGPHYFFSINSPGDLERFLE